MISPSPIEIQQKPLNQRQRAHAPARALLGEISARWPRPFKFPVPLKIGIDADIAAAMPGVDARLIKQALAIHCGKPRYLKNLVNATKSSRRVGLDNMPTMPITPLERADAAVRLAQAIKRQAQRKAERERQEQARVKANAAQNESDARAERAASCGRPVLALTGARR